MYETTFNVQKSKILFLQSLVKSNNFRFKYIHAASDDTFRVCIFCEDGMDHVNQFNNDWHRFNTPIKESYRLKWWQKVINFYKRNKHE